MNLRSLPARAVSSFVIVVGIAGVVAVLISVLSIATGLTRTLSNTVRAERAIILYAGAQSEVESNGDAHESELLADADTVLSAYHRTTFNSVTVWLESPAAFDKLKASVTTNPTLSMDVQREAAYYEQQSKRFGTFLAIVANVIG